MKRLMITLALACACAGLAHGQADRPYNGYLWSEADRSFKLAFVVGFSYGSSAICKQIDQETLPSQRHCFKDPALAAYYPPDATNGQIADGLDHFYSDYRNKSVTLDRAIIYVFLELRGASPEALENYRLHLLSQAAR